MMDQADKYFRDADLARIRELEQRLHEVSLDWQIKDNRIRELEAELAALRQQQSEPVAEVVDGNLGARLVWLYPDLRVPAGTKLYREAAPKQQGKPVGWIDDGGQVFWKDKPPADGTDLYLEAAPRVPEGCEWRCDDDLYMPDTWDGTCGVKWSFIEGGPTENNVHYCPECGGRVKVLAAAPEPKE